MASQHLELYKKYRPKTWSRLIGQGKIVKSLQSAVIQNKVPVAYLFSGERGTGKTSAAFIMAKAVNCPNVDQGEPCNKCSICQNIDNGVQLGVNYISMANKGSADDVREIVSQARLAAPINRQVFILDEIHNLSRQAQDALLIPLEDTKMQALFIFCTTEVNKVLPTILSRVQSRKLSLVDEDTMRKYLNKVVEKEGLNLDDDAITAVIRLGRGSVRDTLSALEQVSETGEAFQDYGGNLLKALCAQNTGDVLGVIAQAAAENDMNGKVLAEQLFSDLRDLMLVASGAEESLYDALPLEDPKQAVRDLLGLRGLVMLLDEVGDAITRMGIGADTRIHLEIALLKGLRKLQAAKAKASA